MTGRTQQCTAPGCEKRPVARRICRAHYQAAWKAGELGQHATLPPRARKRVICPPDHRHAAATTCYTLHQCRCEPCREHRSATDRARKRAHAYGRYDSGLVDAEPVRDHLLLLSEFGMGWKHVAELAGASRTMTRNLIWGRQDPGPRKGELPKRVKRETAEKLLAVKPSIDLLADGASVPALGTRRRLQALVTIGWSQSKLGARLDVLPSNMSSLMQRERVAVGTHRAVVVLFDELWDQQPPRELHRDKIAFSRAVTMAAERRWLAPLAWDDPDSDVEPPVGDEHDVDDIAIELAISGEHVRLSTSERHECVRRLHALRWSDARIAGQLDVTSRTVLRDRHDLNLEAFDQTELERVA